MSFIDIEKFIYEKVKETKLPSVTAGLIKDGNVIWSHAVGYRNLENSESATTRSIYGIGSVTKSFTSLAVMQLVEQGVLSLDDPVEKYLPFDVKPFGELIRIKHFLSHTSGIPALGYAEAVIRATVGDHERWIPAATSNDLITFMRDAGDWVLAKPGERWFYLNEGYELIGAIIANVSCMTYEDYITQRILKPIGMQHSFYSKKKAESDPEFAIPYAAMPEGKRMPSTYPYSSVAAAGGLISSVEDMLRCVEMYLNWGEVNGVQLVSRKSIEEMSTPRIATPQKDNPFGPYDYGYGLGILANFYGQTLVGHSGSVGVATAYMGFIPGKKLGVVVLANGSGYAPSLIGQYALAEALGEDPRAHPAIKIEDALEELTGNYETYKGTMKIQVRRSGDFLTVVALGKFGGNVTPLIPVSLEGDKRTFFTLGGASKTYADFTLDGDKATMVMERYAYHRTGKLVD